MNLTDLRDELVRHADDLGGAPDFRAGVATRVRRTQRRRAAAGAGAALAVAALAVGVVSGVGRPAPTVPAGTPTSTAPALGSDGMPYRVVPDAPGDVVKDGLRYRARVGDDRLATGVIGDPGRGSLALTWTPTTTHVSFAAECYLPGATPELVRSVRVRIDFGAGAGFFESGCTSQTPADGDLPAGGSVPGEPGQGSAGLTVGRSATVHVRLVDGTGNAVTRPGARLVGAVYELGPETEVRGTDGTVVASLPDVREHSGYRYRLASVSAGPVAAIGRQGISLEAPVSGPYLVTYGSAGTGDIRTDPAFYALDGATGTTTGVQEGGWSTAPQPSGHGQTLSLVAGEPSPGTPSAPGAVGTAFIAAYTLER